MVEDASYQACGQANQKVDGTAQFGATIVVLVVDHLGNAGVVAKQTKNLMALLSLVPKLLLITLETPEHIKSLMAMLSLVLEFSRCSSPWRRQSGGDRRRPAPWRECGGSPCTTR